MKECVCLDAQQIKLFSSHKSDDWSTPKWLYRQLDEEFHFDLDPCPLCAEFNGLDIPWNGNIFVNPPYSKIKDFLKKAIDEIEIGNAKTIVFLLFANTDTSWFHDYIYNKAEIRFIRKRIKFVRPSDKEITGHHAMRPSMICIFRQQQKEKGAEGPKEDKNGSWKRNV